MLEWGTRATWPQAEAARGRPELLEGAVLPTRAWCSAVRPVRESTAGL